MKILNLKGEKSASVKMYCSSSMLMLEECQQKPYKWSMKMMPYVWQGQQMLSEEMFLNPNSHLTHPVECHEQSVPPYQLAIVHMILEGPNIVGQIENKVTPAAINIPQLACYYRIKCFVIWHEQHQEMILLFYTRVMIHAQTRKHGLIDKLFKLGLGVSYDRVLQ